LPEIKIQHSWQGDTIGAPPATMCCEEFGLCCTGTDIAGMGKGVGSTNESRVGGTSVMGRELKGD